MLNTSVLSGRTHAYFFIFIFCFFYIFLGVHVSVPVGTDSRLLRRETNVNTEDFLLPIFKPDLTFMNLYFCYMRVQLICYLRGLLKLGTICARYM